MPKLDGVGLIYNRLAAPICQKIYIYQDVTGYMWHVTCDTWHVTHDTWLVGGRWTIFLSFSSLAFTVLKWRCFEDIFTKITDWINQSMSNEGGCRRAPYPPGLLKRDNMATETCLWSWVPIDEKKKMQNSIFSEHVPSDITICWKYLASTTFKSQQINYTIARWTTLNRI